MRIAPFAVATTVVLSLAATRPIAGTAADLLIPFAADVDIEPGAQHVAAFIDTSACEHFAIFFSGNPTSHLRVTFRFGVPDGDTIVRTGKSLDFGGIFDETGSATTQIEMIAPRMQPVLSNIHPSAAMHVNKAWLYCKTPFRRR